jgi:hypothetical protein
MSADAETAPWACGYPNTPVEVAALPYMPHWGHWSISAWTRTTDGSTGVQLASVNFPVGTRGPFTPPDVKRRCFAELHAAALVVLADRGSVAVA